ncbi:MAG: NAD-dependent epimerase/dehydratase family protein [Christensenellaceae bacterium]
MKKSVLVLGGNGFIGQNICKKFLDEGYYVKVYDVSPPAQKNNQIKYYQGNLNDEEALCAAIQKGDVIMHLASSTNPQISMENPQGAYDEIKYAQRLCELCLKKQVTRIVFSSSGGAIYGDNGEKPVSEEAQTWPENNYAIAKLTIERILMMYNIVYQMDNIILRVANPYGFGQNPGCRVGAVTVFADLIMKSEPIHLFVDKGTVRDYIDIEDVAQAFFLSAEWEKESGVTPIFNIGSGKGIAVADLIELIGATLHQEAKVIIGADRKFDVKYNVLDIKKAKHYLKYMPNEDNMKNIQQYVLKLKKTR